MQNEIKELQVFKNKPLTNIFCIRNDQGCSNLNWMKKVLVALLFLLSACSVSFKGTLPDATTRQSSGDIAGRVILSRTLNGRKLTTNNGSIEFNLAHQLGRLLQESGYTLNDSSNNKLTIRINADGHYSHTASTITGLTLFLIPCYAHDDYTMTATYETSKGEQTFEIKDSVYTVSHLFMIFAAPFASGQTAESETLQNMFATIVSKIQQQNQ